MINENKNKYVPVDLPNIQVEVPLDAPDQTQSEGGRWVINPFMRPLVTALAMRHPEWRLVSHQRGGEIKTFHIYRGSECLGNISSGYRGYSQCYDIRSHRTEKALRRKSDVQTKDPKKAIKLAERYFVPRSLAERVEELAKPLRQGVYRHHQHTVRVYSAAYRSMAEFIEQEVVSNWEEVYKKLQKRGLPAGEPYDTFPEAAKEKEAAEAFYNLLEAKQGVAVFVVDGKYAIKESADEGIAIHDELPAKYKRAIGMLKLVEDNSLVPGTGFRHHENAYYIYAVKEKVGGKKRDGSDTAKT